MKPTIVCVDVTPIPFGLPDDPIAPLLKVRYAAREWEWYVEFVLDALFRDYLEEILKMAQAR